jgi:phosphoribosyl 1,2-cyclic phosphodiesterase
MIQITSLASSSKANAYTLTDGISSLLLECGLRFRELQKALNFRLSQFSGLLLTHEHGDHARSIKEVLKSGIDCYMSEGTAEALGIKDHHRAHCIKKMQQWQIGTWTILAFDTVHDCAEPLGYLLGSGSEKILFATDTAYLKYRFQGLTRIMIECNYIAEVMDKNVEAGIVHPDQRKRIRKSHFSLENLVKMLKCNDLSRLKEIHLLHLSGDNSDEDRIKRTIQALVGKPVYIAASDVI